MSKSLDIIIRAKDAATGTFKKLNTSMARINASGKAYTATLNNMNTGSSRLMGTIGSLVAVLGGADIFRRAISSGYSFNKTIEQSRIGLAALVRTFNDVTDAQGHAVHGQQAYEKSIRVSENIQRRLQIEGLKTVATYEQLLRALQEGIGPAFKQGFNEEQVVKFTSQMVQAAAAISLPMDQLGQELRAILDGTIDRNARVAKVLGLTNAKVKELAKSGKLFEYLSKKLKEFEAAGEDMARTFSGAWSNTIDAVQMALGKGIEGSFKRTTQFLLDLQKAVVTVDAEAGTFSFDKRIMQALNKVDTAVVEFLGGTGDLKNWVGNIAEGFSNIATVVIKVAGSGMKVIKTLGTGLPFFLKWVTILGVVKLALFGIIGLPLAIAAQIMALVNAFRALGASSLLAGLASFRAALAAVTVQTGALAIAFKGFIAFAAAVAIIQIVKLVKEIWGWHKATKALKQAQEDFKNQKSFIDPLMVKRLQEISKETGLVIKSFEDFEKLEKSGAIAFDNATAKWIKTDKPADNLKTSPKTRQDDEGIKKIAVDQLRLEKQLANELIEISGNKWDVLKNKAKKHYQDQIALAHGRVDLEAKAEKILNAKIADIYTDREKEEKNHQEKLKKIAEERKEETLKSVTSSEVSRMQASTETALTILQNLYGRGEVALEKYFTKRRNLVEAQYKTEIAALEKLAKAETNENEKRSIDDQIFEKEQAHQRQIIQLLENRETAEKRVLEVKKQVNDMLTGMAIRTTTGAGMGLDAGFTEELAEMDARHAAELDRLRELTAEKTIIDEAYRLQKLEKDQLLADQTKRIDETKLENARIIASGMSDIFTNLYKLTGKKNKEFFYLAKAAALAEAIMNVAQGVTKALAQGGTLGPIMAGVVSAAGAVQIATISSQALASGGSVLGYSPHDKADNVSIMATAGEYMQPVSTVRYYGAQIMEAMRRKLIPRELFSGIRMPSGHSPSGFALASGGSVPAAAGKSVMNITNITDPREIDRYLSSAQGQGSILNVISSNSRKVRKVLS